MCESENEHDEKYKRKRSKSRKNCERLIMQDFGENAFLLEIAGLVLNKELQIDCQVSK
jgi:hypothetical protein